MQGIIKSVDYHFIVRVIKNEVSQEEREFFDSWLSESDSNRETFSEIALLWDKSGTAPNPTVPDINVQWEKISEQIRNNSSHPRQSNLLVRPVNPNADSTDNELPKPQNESATKTYQLSDYETGFVSAILKSRIFQAAALLLIFISAGLYFIKIEYTASQKNQAAPVQLEKFVEVKTRKGERLNVTLRDGSKVYLNNFSRIVFPENFNDTGRDVEMEGEAYFSVMPDKNKPFSVKCGDVVTVVKGTEFNIKSRGKSVNVLVVKGLVETSSPKAEKVYNLGKGELLSYNTGEGFNAPKKVNPSNHLAWRKDKFSFSKTPLSEVMGEIERYYNLNVVFKTDSLKTKTITGFFSSDSLNRILTVIGLTLDIKIKLNNHNLIIDK